MTKKKISKTPKKVTKAKALRAKRRKPKKKKAPKVKPVKVIIPREPITDFKGVIYDYLMWDDAWDDCYTDDLKDYITFVNKKFDERLNVGVVMCLRLYISMEGFPEGLTIKTWIPPDDKLDGILGELDEQHNPKNPLATVQNYLDWIRSIKRKSLPKFHQSPKDHIGYIENAIEGEGRIINAVRCYFC